jgi:hypothetical protein
MLTDSSLASIYTKDGIHVPVAQVYGPPQYQALMASTAVAGTSSPGESGLFCSLLAPVFDMIASLTGHAIDICAPSEILVLTAMLRALNAAVEA